MGGRCGSRSPQQDKSSVADHLGADRALSPLGRRPAAATCRCPLPPKATLRRGQGRFGLELRADRSIWSPACDQRPILFFHEQQALAGPPGRVSLPGEQLASSATAVPIMYEAPSATYRMARSNADAELAQAAKHECRLPWRRLEELE